MRLEGYASAENVIQTASARNAPFRGEMLVDAATGLVLEINVTSRHPSYSVQREVVPVAGT